MIEARYEPQAQRAADLCYTLSLAVEECGADPALTEIVLRVSEAHRVIRHLFGLDPAQIAKVIRPDDIYPLPTVGEGPCCDNPWHQPDERFTFCGETDPSNTRMCILDPHHDGPHGWETCETCGHLTDHQERLTCLQKVSAK